MKRRFLNAVYTNLIIQRDYEPVHITDSGVNQDILILQKYGREVYFLVELIDGDLFDAAAIEEKIKADYHLLIENKSNQMLHIIEVFVFNHPPLPEKTAAISAGLQYQNLAKKHISCFTVDFAGQIVTRLSKLSLNTDAIEKILRTYLKEPNVEYEVLPDISSILALREQEYTIDFKTRKPILTYILLGINIAVWLLLYAYSRLHNLSYDDLNITFGAKENLRIMGGEYWRLITPVFLHDGRNILHLLVNSYSLYVVGTVVERIYGHSKFGLIYFTAGIFASIASFSFILVPAIGASGAIFGLMGALVYYGVEKPKIFKKYFGSNVFTVIAVNIAIGFSIPGIDNFAHLGGLVGGFLTAYAIKVNNDPDKIFQRVIAIIVVFLIAYAGFTYGFHNRLNQDNYRLHLIQEQLEIGTVRATELEKVGEDIFNLNRNKFLRIEALRITIIGEDSQHKYGQAFEHARKLKSLHSFMGYYYSGVLYYHTKQYKLARQELIQARNIEPNEKNTRQLLSEIDKITR